MLIFIVEFFLRFYAYRSNYFQSNWNRLDLFAVSVSFFAFLLGIYIDNPKNTGLRILKAIRIIRLIRLIKRIKILKVILYAILHSAQKLFNVAGLMLLFLYIYSVLGVNLFATIKISKPLDQKLLNYQNVGNAFLLLFRACTGENWHLVMAAISRERSITY